VAPHAHPASLGLLLALLVPALFRSYISWRVEKKEEDEGRGTGAGRDGGVGGGGLGQHGRCTHAAEGSREAEAREGKWAAILLPTHALIPAFVLWIRERRRGSGAFPSIISPPLFRHLPQDRPRAHGASQDILLQLSRCACCCVAHRVLLSLHFLSSASPGPTRHLAV
jgi:hypothetical protein